MIFVWSAPIFFQIWEFNVGLFKRGLSVTIFDSSIRLKVRRKYFVEKWSPCVIPGKIGEWKTSSLLRTGHYRQSFCSQREPAVKYPRWILTKKRRQTGSSWGTISTEKALFRRRIWYFWLRIQTSFWVRAIRLLNSQIRGRGQFDLPQGPAHRRRRHSRAVLWPCEDPRCRRESWWDQVPILRRFRW